MSNFQLNVIKGKKNLYLFYALTILFCLTSIISASAQNGFISVYSFPSDAKVFLDGGYYIGQTPLENRAISPGNHKITLVLLNYDKQAEDIYISPGKSLNLYFNIVPIFGKLKLTSEPEGALIYINNEYVGTTPLTIYLGPEIYQLKLVKPNYQSWSKVITAYANQTVSIRAKLAKFSHPPPGSCNALISKGKNYYSNGLCAEAVMFLRKAIQVCPNSWQAYYYLGESYKCLKLHNEAIEALKKAIELNPKYYKSYMGLGIVYNEIGLFDEAIDAYLKAINLNPESDLLYTLIGIAYNNAGLTSEAIKYHKKAISRNPKDTASYGYLGDIYLQSGLCDEAIKSYKKAVSVSSSNKYTHYHLGNAYLECNLCKEALNSYRQALRIDLAYGEAHFGVGIAYLCLGDKDSARREYETLKELDSSLADKLYTMIK